MNYMTKLNVFFSSYSILRDVEGFLRYNFYCVRRILFITKGGCIGDNVIDTWTFIIKGWFLLSSIRSICNCKSFGKINFRRFFYFARKQSKTREYHKDNWFATIASNLKCSSWRHVEFHKLIRVSLFLIHLRKGEWMNLEGLCFSK